MHRNVVQFSSRKTNNSISTQMNETEKYDEKLEKQIIKTKGKVFARKTPNRQSIRLEMQHKHNGAKFICFSVRLQPFVLRLQDLPPRILLLSWCNFISFLFISLFSSKQIGSTTRPSVVFCVCLDKLRKQIHWKTIQNSVSKLNNSQLICNKIAVAISNVLVLLAHRTQRQHSRPLKRPASGQQKN